MRKICTAAAVAALTLVSSAVSAAEFRVGDLMVAGAWTHITLLNRPAAGYMSIHNMGGTADKIVEVSSAAAERVEIHTHKMEEGIMRMRQIDSIAVAPNGYTELKPGGLHLMIFDLKEPVEMGGKLPVTVVFEKSGPLVVQFTRQIKTGMSGHGDHSKSE